MYGALKKVLLCLEQESLMALRILGILSDMCTFPSMKEGKAEWFPLREEDAAAFSWSAWPGASVLSSLRWDQSCPF